MGKILLTLQTFANMVIDFFYRNPVKRSLIKLASETPLIPGQIWKFKSIGLVYVAMIQGNDVLYWVENDDGEFSIPLLSTTRENFLRWGSLCYPEETDNDNNILKFNPRN